MEVFEALEDLIEYQLCFLFWDCLHPLEVVVKVTVRAVLQPKDDVVLSLKCVVKVDQVLVLYRKEDVLLILQHFHLFGTRYRVFTDEFQCAVLRVHSAFGQVHLREPS